MVAFSANCNRLIALVGHTAAQNPAPGGHDGTIAGQPTFQANAQNWDTFMNMQRTFLETQADSSRKVAAALEKITADCHAPT